MNIITIASAVLIGVVALTVTHVVKHVHQEQICREAASEWMQDTGNTQQLIAPNNAKFFADKLAKLNASCGGVVPGYVELHRIPAVIVNMAKNQEQTD